MGHLPTHLASHRLAYRRGGVCERGGGAWLSERVLALRETHVKRWMAGYQSGYHEAGTSVGDSRSTTRTLGRIKEGMITTEHVNLLVAKKVEMVCFAQYSMYLNFEGGVLLTVESEFEFGAWEVEPMQRMTFPITECRLPRIVEFLVTSADLDSSGSLRLFFSNGDSLRVFKDLEFESYRIAVGQTEFIA